MPRMIRLSFLISAAIGGLAGVLIAPVTTMDFQAGFLLAMKGLTGAIIGGLELSQELSPGRFSWGSSSRLAPCLSRHS